MSITLIQIDKSGSDILEKDYSVILIKNKKQVFGTNIPQHLKDKLLHDFNTSKLNIFARSKKTARKRFRLRFHIAVIILLIQKAELGENNILQICNDYDGHFHEIRNMLVDFFSEKLTKEDIIQTKFTKPSKIDTAGKAFRTKNIGSEHKKVVIDYKDLYKIIKK